MKFAAIADVHGNCVALEAVLSDIAALGITDVAVRVGEGISGMMPVRGSPPQVAIIVKPSVFPSRKERKKAGYDIEVSISSIAVASAAVSPFRRRCLSTMRR